jgi:hypothetical protein
MAKGTSFADKSKGKKKINKTFVKYVKSIKSEKTGHWRFNEQMVALKSGENLDGAIKRLEEESLALDLDLSNIETAVEETIEAQNEQVETEATVVADEVEETVELTEDKEEASVEETPSEVQVAESPSERAPAKAVAEEEKLPPALESKEKAKEEKAAILEPDPSQIVEPDEEDSTEEATKEEKAPVDSTEEESLNENREVLSNEDKKEQSE